MQDISIRTMLLEFVDSNGASHIRQMHIEILRRKPGTPEHTIRPGYRRPCRTVCSTGWGMASTMSMSRMKG